MQRIYETSKLSFTRVGIMKDCELDSCERLDLSLRSGQAFARICKDVSKLKHLC